MRVILHPETLDSFAILLGDGMSEVWAALLTDNTGKQSIVSLPNVTTRPNAFTVTCSGWKLVEQYASSHRLEIIALIHSHPRGTTLSVADSRSLAHSRLPWIVVSRNSTGIAYSVYSSTEALTAFASGS